MKIDRLSAIRQHLYERGSASIIDLTRAVGGSPATLRRDLLTLEREGAVERVHGGARLAQRANTELAFEQRESANLAAKRRIAELAFQMVRPNTTVLFDAGTTVLQLARLLRLNPMPLTAVTNGLPVAQELMKIEQVRVMVLGGELRHDNASIVGPIAEAQLDRMHFDQLFMGAGALSSDGEITTTDLAEASLNARMMAQSRQRILLADASKFDQTATFVVGKLSALSLIVSNAGLSPSWRRRIESAGLELLIAGES